MIQLSGGPMNGWLVKPNAPVLRPGWRAPAPRSRFRDRFLATPAPVGRYVLEGSEATWVTEASPRGRSFRLFFLLILVGMALWAVAEVAAGGVFLAINIGQVFLELLADGARFKQSVEEEARKAGEAGAKTLSQRLTEGLTKAGRSIASTGKTLTQHVTAPIVGLGAAIFKVGADFDTTLRQIVALTDTTAEEIGDVEQAVLGLAGEVGKTPQELAEGFYFLASAGFDTAEALEVLQSTAKASAVGLGTTADISKVVGAAINAFGKENLTASDAVDILLRGIKNGTAEAPEFAASLGRVIGAAGQMGASFDDVIGALSAMTLQGISADEAATSLNQVFVSLLKTTPAAEKAMNDLGLSSEGLRRQLREEGLLSVLETLEEAFRGNDTAAAEVFGNVRALRGVLALTGANAEQVAAVFNDVANGTQNIVQAFLDTEGPGREFGRAMTALQITLIKLGADVLPVITEGLTFLGSIVTTIAGAFKSLPEPVRAVAVRLLAVAAAAGPVLFVTGKLMSGVGQLIGLFVKLKGAALLLGPALTKAIAGSAVLGPLAASISTALGKIPGAAAVRTAAMKAGTAVGRIFGSGMLLGVAAAFSIEEFLRRQSEVDAIGDRMTEGLGDALRGKTLDELKEARRKLAADIAANPFFDSPLDIFGAGNKARGMLAEIDRLIRESTPFTGGRSRGGDWGADLTDGMEDGIDGGASGVTGAVTDLVGKVGGILDEATAIANQKGSDVAGAWAQGLTDRRTSIEAAIDKMVEAAENGLTKEEEIERFRRIGRQIRDDLLSEIPEQAAWAQTVAQFVDEGLIALGEDPMFAGGEKVGKGVESGLRSTQSMVKSAADAIAFAIRDALGTLGSSAYGWGYSIGRETARGTKAGVSSVPITQTGARAQPRAEGGPVSAMTPYLVGETGPELFVPKVSGVVVPNDLTKTLSDLSAGPGKTINNNLTVNQVDRPPSPFEIADQLVRIERLGTT